MRRTLTYSHAVVRVSTNHNTANLRNALPGPLWILLIPRIFLLNPEVMRHTLSTIGLLCCLCVTAFGKGKASLSGKITGPDGKGLANVSVVLRDGRHVPAAHNIRTAADGSFTLSGLDSGQYNALISLAGFESQHITAIGLTKEALRLNVQLGKAGSWGSSVASHRYTTETVPVATASRPVSGRHKKLPHTTSIGEAYGAGSADSKGVEVHAVREYSAPIKDTASPGGHSVKSADMIE